MKVYTFTFDNGDYDAILPLHVTCVRNDVSVSVCSVCGDVLDWALGRFEDFHMVQECKHVVKPEFGATTVAAIGHIAALEIARKMIADKRAELAQFMQEFEKFKAVKA